MNCRTRRTYNVQVGHILQNDRACAVEEHDIYSRRIGHIVQNIRTHNVAEQDCTTNRHDIDFRTYVEGNNYLQNCV
jgi:hypothetical protein